MGGKASRDKGIRFELAMASLFRRVFPGAFRGKQNDNPRYCDLEGTPTRWELKHWKDWPSVVAALKQARQNAADFDDDRPVGIIVKRDYQPPIVVHEVVDYLRFCEENLYSPNHDNVVKGPWEEPDGDV